ncbi:hypothetical protein Aduo_018433 [Ancylostoma duodenale]
MEKGPVVAQWCGERQDTGSLWSDSVENAGMQARPWRTGPACPNCEEGARMRALSWRKGPPWPSGVDNTRIRFPLCPIVWGTTGRSSANEERVCVGPVVRNAHEYAIRWRTDFSYSYSTHKKDFMFGPI